MQTTIQISVDLINAARKSSGPLGKCPISTLQTVEKRYRQFLLMAKKYPSMRLSPTKDIDAMWHLHMLHPRAYFHDCMHNFGAILDHNPGFGLASKAEWQQLEVQFTAVKNLWAKEFGETYDLYPSPKEKTAEFKSRAERIGGIEVCESEMIGGIEVCESEMIGGIEVCESEMIGGIEVCESEMIGGIEVCESEMIGGIEVCESEMIGGIEVCESEMIGGIEVCESEMLAPGAYSPTLVQLGIFPPAVSKQEKLQEEESCI